LIAVDLDRKNGRDGVSAFDALLDQHSGDLSSCPVTETPSLGFHLFFKQPSGRAPLGNATGSLPAGVDIRGDGGYVLAPGAVLDDGQLYDGVPGFLDLCDGYQDAPLIFDWIVDLIEAEPERHDAPFGCPSGEANWVSGAPVAGAWNAKRATAYIESALNGWMNKLSVALEGTRNNLLNDAVYYISGLIHCPTFAASTVTERQVWDSMSFACSRNGYLQSKKDGPAAFRATFRSAWNAGIVEPARGPAPHP
jgi:Bifunctional DNA primase/polymerase, N-terminal